MTAEERIAKAEKLLDDLDPNDSNRARQTATALTVLAHVAVACVKLAMEEG